MDNRIVDILFFTFRSIVNANKIDPHFLFTTLSLDFSLRLPQSDGPIALAPATNLNSTLSTPPRNSIQTSASGPSVIFTLTNETDDVLRTMDEAQFRQFITDARKSTNPTPTVATSSVNILSTFTSYSSTPMMHRVRTSVASGRLLTYLGPMNFLDNQASFVSVFGLNPVMLRVCKRATDTFVIEDTEYLTSKLGNYCDTCQLHLI